MVNLKNFFLEKKSVLKSLFFIFSTYFLLEQFIKQLSLNCNGRAINFLIENQINDYSFKNYDIYISESLNNFFCIGQVISINDFSNNIEINIGSNPRFTFVFFLILIIFFLVTVFVSLTKLERQKISFENVIIIYSLVFLFLSNYFYGLFKLDFYFFGLFLLVPVYFYLSGKEIFNFIYHENSKSIFTKIIYIFSTLFLLQIFSFIGIYDIFRLNSWQIIALFILISSKFTIKEKILYFSFLVFSSYVSILICVLLILIFCIVNELEIFKNNESNFLYFFAGLYLVLKIQDLSYHFTIDPDHFVWVFTAIRMDDLNLNIFEATLESKGILLNVTYYVIYLISKLFTVSIWHALSTAYVLISLIIMVLFNMFFSKFYKTEKAYLYISLIMLFDLVNDERVKFDARFLGSLFIFLGLFFILRKNNDFVGGLFLGCSAFSLLTFGIPILALTIYLVLIQKKYKIFYGQIFFGLLSLGYLLVTGQIYESYIMNFLIYFGSQYPYTKIPLIDIINRNPFLFISIILLSILVFKNKKIHRNEVFISGGIWWVSEYVHMYLSGPRFEHYSILILIPSYFFLGILISEISSIKSPILKNTKIDFSILSVSLIFIFYILHSNYFPYYKNFPQEMIGDEIIISNKTLDINQNKISDKYEVSEFSSSTDYRYGIYVTYSPNTFNKFFEEERILPAGSAWQIVWHRADFINYDYFFPDDYFYSDLLNDYSVEKPDIAIVDLREEKRLRNKIIIQYINDNFNDKNCVDEICIYTKNK